MKFTLVAFVSMVGLVAAAPNPNPAPVFDSEPAEFATLAKRQCSPCRAKVVCCAFPPNVNYCYKC